MTDGGNYLINEWKMRRSSNFQHRFITCHISGSRLQLFRKEIITTGEDVNILCSELFNLLIDIISPRWWDNSWNVGKNKQDDNLLKLFLSILAIRVHN